MKMIIKRGDQYFTQGWVKYLSRQPLDDKRTYMNFREKLKLAFLTEDSLRLDSIANVLNISEEEVREIQKSDKYKYIQKVRTKFKQKKYKKIKNSRQLNSDFEFKDFAEFYFWYRVQPRKCAYCTIQESILVDLFTRKVLTSNRNRGKSLEIERKDSTSNKYNKKNCILACYFCNNHKSDIISKDDHVKYFAKPIYKYLTDKWETSNKTLEKNK